MPHRTGGTTGHRTASGRRTRDSNANRRQDADPHPRPPYDPYYGQRGAVGSMIEVGPEGQTELQIANRWNAQPNERSRFLGDGGRLSPDGPIHHGQPNTGAHWDENEAEDGDSNDGSAAYVSRQSPYGPVEQEAWSGNLHQNGNGSNDGTWNGGVTSDVYEMTSALPPIGETTPPPMPQAFTYTTDPSNDLSMTALALSDNGTAGFQTTPGATWEQGSYGMSTTDPVAAPEHTDWLDQYLNNPSTGRDEQDPYIY